MRRRLKCHRLAPHKSGRARTVRVNPRELLAGAAAAPRAVRKTARAAIAARPAVGDIVRKIGDTGAQSNVATVARAVVVAVTKLAYADALLVAERALRTMDVFHALEAVPVFNGAGSGLTVRATWHGRAVDVLEALKAPPVIQGAGPGLTVRARRRAVAVVSALAANAREVVRARIVVQSRRLGDRDAEPLLRRVRRPRAAAVEEALEAEVLEAARTTVSEKVAVPVDLALDADLARSRLDFQAAGGAAVVSGRASLVGLAAAKWREPKHAIADAAAVDVRLTEDLDAVLAVVDALALAATLVRPAARAAAANGVAGRIGLFLFLPAAVSGQLTIPASAAARSVPSRRRREGLVAKDLAR